MDWLKNAAAAAQAAAADAAAQAQAAAAEESTSVAQSAAAAQAAAAEGAKNLQEQARRVEAQVLFPGEQQGQQASGDDIPAFDFTQTLAAATPNMQGVSDLLGATPGVSDLLGGGGGWFPSTEPPAAAPSAAALQTPAPKAAPTAATTAAPRADLKAKLERAQRRQASAEREAEALRRVVIAALGGQGERLADVTSDALGDRLNAELTQLRQAATKGGSASSTVSSTRWP